nr:hypothetical protein [uncultured Flavobacterium sp.]
MSAKTDKFKFEFTKLSDVEKTDLIKFINEYQNGSTLQKGNLNESLRKSLGPTDAGKCGCCGK